MSVQTFVESRGKEPLSFADQLVKQFGPPAGTFEISLPPGFVLTFKRIQSFSELQSFKREAMDFVQNACTPANVLWKDLIPETDDAKIAAFTISYYGVDPTPERVAELAALNITAGERLNQMEALKLCGAPWLLDHLVKQIDANQIGPLSQATNEAVIQAKND